MDTATLGPWALFLSAFISATIAPGGSEAVLAVLVTTQQHDAGWLLLVASTGNTLGAVTTWILGMLVARGYPPERFRRLQDSRSIAIVQRWGVLALLFTWLPIIGDGLSFAGGWLRLPFIPALCAIAIGKAARYAAIIYALS